MADSTCADPASPSSSSLKDITHAAWMLVHWQRPRRSALTFGASLLVLVSVATLSAISVVSYLLLSVLCVSITFRVYKSVVQAVHKSQQGHPFRSLLDRDISLSPETARRLAEEALVHVNRFTCQTRKLLLVEDLVDSLKLAVAMWLMTYVGAIFNVITLLILGDILAFTAPLVYQKKKTQIDQKVELIRKKVDEILQKLHDRLPGSVKRTKVQ